MRNRDSHEKFTVHCPASFHGVDFLLCMNHNFCDACHFFPTSSIMQSPPRLFLDLKQPSDTKPPVVLHKTSWSQFSTYSFLKSLTEEHVEQLITRMVRCIMRSWWLRVAHVPSTTNACVSAFHIRCSERANSSQISCLKWWWKAQAKHMARVFSKNNNLAYDHFKNKVKFRCLPLTFLCLAEGENLSKGRICFAQRHNWHQLGMLFLAAVFSSWIVRHAVYGFEALCVS